MLNTSFAPWPSYTEEEIDAVAAVLRSNRVNYWTGDECRHFEREFAAFAGSKHAIALANGTLALDAALAALDIGPGDEVIVTPRTFIASVSSVIQCGATPVFADVDRDSGNISPATVAAVLSGRTRAVVPVHLAGWPCEMDGMLDIARDGAIKIIEDCAQAHGAEIGGRSVGTFGDIGAWSFCQDKIVTTGGEGGMVTTDDEVLWNRMWSMKDHGKSYDRVYHEQHPPGFRWLHDSFGTNWRMLEMQAVIGRIQLRRLADWTRRRGEIALRIKDACDAFPGVLRTPLPGEGITHAFYRLYSYVERGALRPDWSRDRIVAEITARGVPVYQGSCSEVYHERAFDGSGLRPAEPLPIAQELGDTSLMWLVHPTITDEQLDKVREAIGTVIAAAAH